MSRLPDPILDGLARGWRVHGGRHAKLPPQVSCDVAIVGTGAGAGITAELLTQAGLDVVLIEEGPLKSSRDFNQLESEAYPSLYQESASRKTADKSINIMQGRCVGGSTTVNWTSSFRTPPATLRYWAQHFGLAEMTEESMAPWFAQAERRLNIAPWQLAPNENNSLLRAGCAARHRDPGHPRNVKGCWDPAPAARLPDERQAIDAADDAGGTRQGRAAYVQTAPSARSRREPRRRARVRRVNTTARPRRRIDADRRQALCGRRRRDQLAGAVAALAGTGPAPPARQAHLPASGRRHGIDLRSRGRPLERRAAVDLLRPFSRNRADRRPDRLQARGAAAAPGAVRLDAARLRPAAIEDAGGHAAHPRADRADGGFNEQSVGGSVALRSDGSPVLDYPLTDFVMDGARRAFLSMAEIQFAAGARSVQAVHEQAGVWTSWAQARDAIAKLPMQPFVTRVVSAHVMGGCPMAGDEARGVVRPDGRHWQIANLSVHDGSLFPTSVGANPQLSIYGLVNKLATGLAKRLANRDVVLA
jgi:choline dehydrogenase-like flavoprotein